MVSELDRAKRALVTLINLWLLSVLLLWKWCGILKENKKKEDQEEEEEEEPEEAEAKPQASLKPAEEWGRSPEDPHACYESSFEI